MWLYYFIVSSKVPQEEFGPARLSAEDMEYTTIQQVLEKLEQRFKSVEE